MWNLTSEQERDVLRFDPWGERDATYRVLRESFVVSRGAHECAICFGKIAPGERVWSRAEVDDGKAATFRFCPECCWCIAHRYDDDCDGFERLYARWDVGRERAEASSVSR